MEGRRASSVVAARQRFRDRAPRVSVIVPALNEERNIPYVLTRLPFDLHEVILVDGHSTDATVKVAQAIRPDIRVVQQTRRGKGNALASGFAASTGDIIAMVDADGSTDPAELPRFVAALLTGADLAKGSRFAPGGGSADITRIRALGNRGLCTLVNALFRARYSDLCYGYVAFWRDCLPHLNVDCDGFEVETLICIRAAKAGLTIHEVPSHEGQRVHGLSNLNAPRDGMRVLRTILFEALARHRLEAGSDRLPGYGWDGVERRLSDRRGSALRPHPHRRASDRSVMPSLAAFADIADSERVTEI
ncbi:MAG TPA: glycosyltransferase family 2 protein [Chloroflexota bacterium]|nr:glycosyltransferase family 2 protein [Chloroflexota bacterium]